MAELTANNSSFASCVASAWIALTSAAVKLVPPPRGKSTSSFMRFDISWTGFSGTFVDLSVESLLFLTLRNELSSRTRFWPAMFLINGRCQHRNM